LTAKFSIFAHVFYFCPKTKYKKSGKPYLGIPLLKFFTGQ